MKIKRDKDGKIDFGEDLDKQIDMIDHLFISLLFALLGGSLLWLALNR